MRKLMRSAIVALLAVWAAAAADHAEVWTSADLKAASSGLSSEAEAKRTAGKPLGTWASHSAALWRRAKNGEAELHKTKTDLLVIQDGAATLITGGTIPDAHTTTPNEVRGSSIRGGESHKVGPGDVIRIPPNTPHQFILEKGQTVSYLAVKLSR